MIDYDCFFDISLQDPTRKCPVEDKESFLINVLILAGEF